MLFLKLVLIGPIAIAFAVLFTVVTWLWRGGLTPLFAGWRCLLSAYDRYLIEHLHSSFVARMINAIEKARRYHASFDRYTPPRFFLLRFYDTLADPLTNPFNALYNGAILLYLLVPVLARLLPEQYSQYDNEVLNAASVFPHYLSSVRPDRDWKQWLCVLFAAGMAGFLLQSFQKMAVLLRSKSAYASLLSELESERQGLIRLEPQTIPPGWIDKDIVDSAAIKASARLFVEQDFTESIEGSRIAFTEARALSTLHVYAFDLTESGKLCRRMPLCASYSLLNVLGPQYVVLDSPLNPEDNWSKFTLLHEVGHLRGAGIRALFMHEVGFLVALISSAILARLTTSSPLFPTHGIICSSLAFLYTAFVLLRWCFWELGGYSELCADLYALAKLKPSEIADSFRLKTRLLRFRCSAAFFQTFSFHNGFKHAFTQAQICFSSGLHLIALKTIQLFCRNTSARWYKKFTRPPFQFRPLNAAFSLWFIFLAFTADITFRTAATLWLLAFVSHMCNQFWFGQVRSLEEALKKYGIDCSCSNDTGNQ